MQEIENKISEMLVNAKKAIDEADSLTALEAVRLAYLGQKGELTSILKGLASLDKEVRPKVGQLANQAKLQMEALHDQKKEKLYQASLSERLSREWIDVTAPGVRVPVGHIHPLTQIREEIIAIFGTMGFVVADGPEVETDYYNFDALNTPASHPARDEQDTFYTNMGPHVLLRSQTSTVQIRVMENKKPPLRIIAPGRVYRNEEVNARKYPLFHQVEGLLIDKDVTFGQLKGTLTAFIQALFRKPVKTRFRPDFFPFTEPSAELDSQCPFCNGKGCKTCGGRGWLELLGCGMVDPNVLTGAGIDPEEYSGFAFGMGLERLAMLKYGVNDIRNFYTNDLRFLEQF
ncbi:MAG: phenylalanyl-tRNA synthetase alpha chain [Cyanobacteriota bacterium erpe_2018_sw_39hr_WHONDRS-SW48-000098_B_bin.30]|jgi:phenylalanyl-tRNA synthetase alpha chain|nr:phenylalanyl-tRNA synthetase alpha chain [Cyanobacteriota bacterium erpe_2018_sw_39hr_WHONDRS-SW48-000098_B_bin.30]